MILSVRHPPSSLESLLLLLQCNSQVIARGVSVICLPACPSDSGIHLRLCRTDFALDLSASPLPLASSLTGLSQQPSNCSFGRDAQVRMADVTRHPHLSSRKVPSSFLLSLPSSLITSSLVFEHTRRTPASGPLRVLCSLPD